MADKAISALTAATTLTGAELVPVVQSGTTKKATITQVIASAIPSQKTITDANSPYTVLSTDRTIFADATGADVIILLPASAASSGRELTVKKIDGSGNRVQLTPDGSDEIEGTAAVFNITTPLECEVIQANGIISWWIISKFL